MTKMPKRRRPSTLSPDAPKILSPFMLRDFVEGVTNFHFLVAENKKLWGKERAETIMQLNRQALVAVQMLWEELKKTDPK